MDNKTELGKNYRFSLSKINIILIAVSFVIIVIGFLLMTGSSTLVDFNPEIFSTRRITVGPMISFFGFILIVFAILYQPKKKSK